MSSLPLCQGGDSMSQEDLTPGTCTNYVEKQGYSYCQDHLLFFQQARPKCPTDGCDKHVKWSYPRNKNLETCVDHLPKQGPPCPFCTGWRMINSQTGLPFKTCFHCRFRCPEFLTCGGYRGQSRGSYRYPTCSKCRYGSNYRAPAGKTKGDEVINQVMDPCFDSEAPTLVVEARPSTPTSVDVNEVD